MDSFEHHFFNSCWTKRDIELAVRLLKTSSFNVEVAAPMVASLLDCKEDRAFSLLVMYQTIQRMHPRLEETEVQTMVYSLSHLTVEESRLYEQSGLHYAVN